ncbi:MAG: hydrogenase maturation protease, partial [Candidatus Omnitrophica bacterium]|nr:hydrogenase maturation protease [Candidatus Omnitrophota bacterium]
LGTGNTMSSDDGAGSILAARLKDKVSPEVIDAGAAPENYLEKVIQKKPDTVIIFDAADFGGKPGELKILEAQGLKTANLFSTHNASISLVTNYLQSNLALDIIILIIQPKSITFGDKLTKEVADSVDKIESFFLHAAEKEKG